MSLAAAIFDLDDTLLDSSALLDARDQRDWATVFSSLASVVPFAVVAGERPVEKLPAEAGARGLKVGLYTHSPEAYASELLHVHEITVDEMVTGSDRLPLKPDPTGLLTVARALEVAPEHCVYIGDSVGDFGAAAAAGMTSIGVSWSRRTPESWRHGWPDIAVDRPSRALQVLDGALGLEPLAEALAADHEPVRHWGSLMRLGEATYGLGRYFPMGDRRYPRHALSHLIIDSKDDQDAREALAEAFGALAGLIVRNTPELIVAVPPAPDEEDRFDGARQALAAALGARDGADVLRQLYAVDDYKSKSRAARAGYVVDRFEATESLSGEVILLIDDVVTTGSQANACREALNSAGAGQITIAVAAVTQDSLADPCPRCGAEWGGTVRVRRRRRDGVEFRACSRYPSCAWTANLEAP